MRSPQPPLSSALAVTLAACGPVKEEAQPGECPSWSDAEAGGQVVRADVDEASGLVLSTRHADVLWTHNDDSDGDDGVIYAIGVDGADRGSLTLPGADPEDWEDIAAGYSGGVDWLFVGDIGDNDRERGDLRVWRAPEPETLDTEQRQAVLEGFTFGWPDGPRDAEAMAWDPMDERLYVWSRDAERAELLRLPALEAANDGATAEVVHTMDLSAGALAGVGAVRAADITADGKRLLLRTDHQVLVYHRSGDQGLSAVLSQEPCMGTVPPESDGEAIAATPGGYATLAEGDAPTIWSITERE